MADTVAENTEKLDSYITDMLALETHIHTALASQTADLDEHSEFTAVLVRIRTTCETHVHALETLTQRRAQNVGGISKLVKKGIASAFGLGAAAVDFIRTEKLPKNLRDDYTAISLAYIGNLMLHTAALTFHDTEVADLARTHLNQHAQSMMAMQHAIPAATVAFLASEGVEIDATVLPEIEKTIRAAWN